MGVTTIGIDLAKSVFQVHGVDGGVGSILKIHRHPGVSGSTFQHASSGQIFVREVPRASEQREHRL
jgi:hypothetical protein